jgi:PKD repeat protein
MNKIKNLKKWMLLLFITAFLGAFFVFPQTASADLCQELSDAAGGFFTCGEEEVASFTGFEGGLQPPSPEGYDPTLTQQTNLRDFIVNVVNFALGFLGLVAVIVVIYGGFLYVTAGGEEEKTTKGKKSVTYAVIGIVIIIISYALVNTVISGIGQGTDVGQEQQLAGTAEELTGDQTQAVQRLFYMAATRVERSAKDLANSYQHYVTVKDAIADLESIPPVQSARQLHVYLGDVKRGLRNIISASGELSRTSEAAKNAEDFVDLFLNQSQEQLEVEWSDWWSDKSIELQDEIEYYFTESGPEGESIWSANVMDFSESVNNIIENLNDLKNQIEQSGLVTTQETEFGIAYERAVETLENLRSTGVSPPTNPQVVDALEALNDLHTVVQNIQFVAPVITTDVDRGNAPLIVNVDALNSVRPDFESIQAEDITWDFGDGTVVENKFATSHVYRETGTYVIKLQIEGDPEQNIASGVAYKEIKVDPPASQINLQVNIGDRDLGHMSLYRDGFLVIDKNRLNVTLTEARDVGITFDASESRGGFQAEQQQEAGETYIQTISWTFGDGSDRIFGEMIANDIQTHYYGEEGTYPVVVEVTDSRGIKDRKVFEVVVDSPAARIDIDPDAKALINEEIEFDAGNSSSDVGQITGYNWSIQNPQLRFSAEESSETFSRSFENPGLYNVNLTVTDNAGETAVTSRTLTVESEPPEAQFEYSVPDPSKPHIYFLDGTNSFDPDGNIQEGNYSYEWRVAGVSEDYDFVNENGEADPEGDTQPRTYLKFYRTGEYNVTLDVNDLNEPENPGVPDKQTINVDSILDIAFGNLEQSAAILNENLEATIDFVGISENGIAYQWDFGDVTPVVSGDIVGDRVETSHTYTEAGNYDVRFTVFDREDNENTLMRRVTVGEADMPVAVISVSVDGNEIYDLSEPIEVNRKNVINFNADRSINRDGTGRRLAYQWNIGTEQSTKESVTHTFDDLGEYTVTLKVLDKNDLTKTSTAEVKFNVVGETPTLQAFTAVPQQTELTTPVRVKLNAIGAEDPDGQISKYLWWYYDVRDPDMRLGHTITQSPQAFITIGTRGIEGEEVNYRFDVQMTDQENFSVEASEILEENMMPSLTVVNGPNEIPVARFNVDRTNVMVGESVNFTSSSADPDGRIVQYVWDFEGDGFGNNEPTSLSTISHVYEEPAVEGINVRLKVIDNNFAESISIPVKIYVDTDAQPPTAAFTSEPGGSNTVEFLNNSFADEDAGAEIVEYRWDFDISSELESADSDGDGVKDNDVDSTETDPEHEYPESGVYRVKLTVEDNFGNTDEVINFVNAKPADGEVDEDEESELDARFTTEPPVSPDDGAVHLQGDFAEVSFDFTGSQGDIERYVFDNNIYVDSNDDGRKANDVDYMTTTPGVYTTTYNPEVERIEARLSVYDSEGNVDISEVRIVFDENQNQLGVNILGITKQNQIATIVVSLALFAIVSLSLYLHSKRSNRLKRAAVTNKNSRLK